MRKFISIFTLCVMTIAGFLACEDKVDIQNLTLGAESAEVAIDDSIVVPVVSGNGDYLISYSVENVVEAKIVPEGLQLKGLKVGSTKLWITDARGKDIYLNVKVNMKGVDMSKAQFNLNGDMKELNVAGGYALTYSPYKATVASPDGKESYMLTWKGGLTDGSKTNAVLKIVRNGVMTEKVVLSNLVISTADKGTSLTFSGGDYNGFLVVNQ